MNAFRIKPFFLPPLLHAAGFLFALAIGWRMRIRWDFYQILDREPLRDRLAESLWYMHSQPPALNLILGLALKLESAAGIGVEHTLLAFNYAMGLAAVLCLTRLCFLLIPSKRAALVCACLIAAHPVVHSEQFRWYYPIHEMALLSAAALALHRVVRNPSAGRFAALCAVCVTLTYWRALFHFAWTICVTGGVLAFLLRRSDRLPPGNGRRAYVAIFAATLLILFAWPAKNQAIFGRFVYSSWMWFNMAQGLGLSPMEHPDLPIDPEFAGIPVLRDEFKADGTYNWNHYDFMHEADFVRAKVIETLRDHPEYLPKKAFRNYWNLTRFSGRHPYGGGYEINGRHSAAATLWMGAYERILHADFRRADRLRNWDFRLRPPLYYHISGFWLALPILLVFVLHRVRTGSGSAAAFACVQDPQHHRSARRGTLAFMLLTTLYVLAMCMFVDGNESNRIRFCIEPLLFIFAGMAFCAVVEIRRRNAEARGAGKAG